MADIDPPIIESPLSKTVTRHAITVQVAIFKIGGDAGWTLEVVNAEGTSTVWEEPFDTDAAAFKAFLRAVETEGMETFLDDDTSGWTTIH
ncbi:hypothetical protein V474_24090 [Novosphingobium barchaimii LL02]|uniref:Uncharacterized protein n=1 Tax=Novosphingobium barchaimii LL02 TaxID=1114963 RepID=A0A0J7XLW0_9SPHN|nr:hypothetical protein [Novosphingobium barchaimii]KMS52634.1 hypothetical protein V474_24090 [Novosphingobium barchaimii LL02]